MTLPIQRAERRAKPQQIPQPIQGQDGLVQVDTTWGTIQPAQVAESVGTVGELEVIEYLKQGLPLVDSRTRNFYDESTIPGARNIPHPDATARIDELNREHPTIFFCNGPQCGQSPAAVRALLEAGYPAEKILYYRGGLHDWLTLGLPVLRGEDNA